MIQTLLRLLAVDIEATRRSLASIDTAPADHPQTARALSIMAHTQQASYIWLSRCGGVPARPFVMFPQQTAAQTLAEAEELAGLWRGLLEPLAGDGFVCDKVVRYSSTEGVAYQSTLGEIVLHVCQHGAYHRGQVALLVKGAGGTPASTDLIVLTRRRGD